MKYLFLSFLCFQIWACSKPQPTPNPLANSSPPASAEVASTPADTRFSVFRIVARKGLNLRAAPTINSKRILTIPYETTGAVLEVKKKAEVIQNRPGYWLKVRYNEKEGWIFSGFVHLGEQISGLGPPEIDHDTWSYKQLSLSQEMSTAAVISQIKIPEGQINLIDIKGVVTKDSSGFEFYCGAPPRIVNITNNLDGKRYTYLPTQNSDGRYNPELETIRQVVPGIVAIREFNGECSCRTAHWDRLILLGSNGAFTVVQDLEETSPYCGEFGTTLLRRTHIDGKNRRIYVMEREGQCLGTPAKNGPDGLETQEVGNYGAPKYKIFNTESNQAAHEIFKTENVPKQYRSVFEKMYKDSDQKI